MILKVGLNFSNNYNIKELKNKKSSKITPAVENSYNPCFYIPSFKGVNKNIFSKLKRIEKLHCPTCGVALLPKETFTEIINTKCKTVTELAQLLRKNKKYIQLNTRGIINDFEDFANSNPEMSAADSITKTRDALQRKKGFWLTGLQKDVSATQGLEPIIIKKINTALEKFRNNQTNYNECKAELFEALTVRDTPEKKQIYLKITNLLRELFIQNFVLSIKDAHNKTADERVETFLGKLFKNSLAVEETLNSSSEYIEDVDFLECTSCNTSKTFHHLIKNGDTILEKNIMQYFNDIYESKIYDASFTKYMLNFIHLIKSISKYKINPMFVKSDKFKDIKNEIFKLESPSTEFTLSKISGVPCACCGSTILTHEEKEAISLDIKKTKNLFELKNVIEKYSSYCKDTYKTIFQRYNNILENNPDISEVEMIHLLRTEIRNNISEHINETINLAKENLIDCSENDKEIYESYINLAEKNLFNYKSTFFPIKTFYEIFDTTLLKLEDKEKRHFFFRIKEKVYDEAKRQFVIHPPHKTQVTNKSDLKDTMSFIFTRSLSTVDHIHAKSKSGENDDNNYMILCKDCNQAKQSMDFITWVKKNSTISVRYNLQKYLFAISEKIKTLKLEKFYNYPANFVRQIRKETNHSITLKLPKD